MLVPSYNFLRYWHALEQNVCSSTRMCRSITTYATLRSGHSRWSTIKHDKAKKDASKTKQRTVLSKEIERAVQSVFTSSEHPALHRCR